MSTPTVVKNPGHHREYLVGSTSSGNMKVFSLNTPYSARSWREIFR